MQTTLNVDDELITRVSELTGFRERTSLGPMGLGALNEAGDGPGR